MVLLLLEELIMLLLELLLEEDDVVITTNRYVALSWLSVVLNNASPVPHFTTSTLARYCPKSWLRLLVL
jgi:hypothetical protein